MKTLYLECQMGAAGDMLMAALLELLPEDEGIAFLETMNGLGIPGVQITRHTAEKCGILGTHLSVTIDGEEETSSDVHLHEEALGVQPEGELHVHSHGGEMHQHGHGHEDHHHHGHRHGHGHPHAGDAHTHDHHHHTGLPEIQALLKTLLVSDWVRAQAAAVYGEIAQAEAKAHGRPVAEVHFHEVGMMDAVADIVGVCLLLEAIAPDRILASPVHVGSGQVHCAHGVLPVPAPATAHILQGVPTYGGQIQGELCTPTGAALLKHFVNAFGPQPVMAAERIGYGMGKKDFSAANCLRAFLGEADQDAAEVVELRCNLDDMTGEDIGFATEQLLARGALDVYTIPVQMKKDRPGCLLVCLCNKADEAALAQQMLQHTTTLGIRAVPMHRYVLDRSSTTIESAYGAVRRKTGKGFGVEKHKLEFEDLAAIARETGVPLATLRSAFEKTEKA